MYYLSCICFLSQIPSTKLHSIIIRIIIKLNFCSDVGVYPLMTGIILVHKDLDIGATKQRNRKSKKVAGMVRLIIFQVKSKHRWGGGQGFPRSLIGLTSIEISFQEYYSTGYNRPYLALEYLALFELSDNYSQLCIIQLTKIQRKKR